MDWIGQASAWLNDTMVKTVLLMLGALVLKKWQPFVNKAIPVAVTFLSAIVSTLHVMFPTITPDAATSSFAFASFAGMELHAVANPAARGASWVWNTLAPVAFAIASHSGLKNTWQWREVGSLFWPGGRPERR